VYTRTARFNRFSFCSG